MMTESVVAFRTEHKRLLIKQNHPVPHNKKSDIVVYIPRFINKKELVKMQRLALDRQVLGPMLTNTFPRPKANRTRFRLKVPTQIPCGFFIFCRQSSSEVTNAQEHMVRGVLPRSMIWRNRCETPAVYMIDAIIENHEFTNSFHIVFVGSIQQWMKGKITWSRVDWTGPHISPLSM